MKFVLIVVVTVALASDLISAASNYRVRRQGAKGGGYVEQQKTYSGASSAAVAGNRRTRPLPARAQVQNSGSARQQTWSDDSGAYNPGGGGGSEGEASAEPAVYGWVAGAPGVDFPAYAQVPKTSFSCGNVPYEPGMYADEEAQCQAYHVCFQGRKESFLCGVGTVFNQAILACDYWHSVECGRSKEFYSKNEELGKPGAEPGPGGQAQAGAQEQSQIASTTRQRAQPRPQYQPQAQPQGQYQQQAQAQGQYQPQAQPRPQTKSSPRAQYRPQAPAQGQYQPQEQEQGQYQPRPQYKPQPRPQYKPRPQAPAQPRPQAPQLNRPSVKTPQPQSQEEPEVNEDVEIAEQPEDAEIAAPKNFGPAGPQPLIAPAPGPRASAGRASSTKSKYRPNSANSNQLSPSYQGRAKQQARRPTPVQTFDEADDTQQKQEY